MAKLHVNTKRLMISKANSRIVVVTAVAAFLVVFALVASKTLVSQAAYQNRVIGADKKALDQLKADLQTTTQLKASYQAFVDMPQNVLGGNPQGSGAQDGDNAKVVLDALPSQYDFPAMAASLEKLLTSQNVQITSITGTDEEVAQAADQSSPNPQPVAMPFQITVSGNYQAIQNLVGVFGKSIRPFQIQTMQLSGGEDKMSLTLSAQTFYQPGKLFNISTEVIK
jgi:Tfp pilus assembly protein PilO